MNFEVSDLETNKPSTQAQVARSSPKLTISHPHKLTYASLQNAVPLIERVILDAGDEDLSGGELYLSVHPKFAEDQSWTFDALVAGKSIDTTKFDATLDNAFFDSLDEAERGHLRLTVEFNDGRKPLEAGGPIELLARDQWGGIDEMGQLLAAFVLPNEPVVGSILRAASDALQKQGLHSSIDGYQSKDPRRAWSLSAAIWSAIEAMDLRYSEPPASFELKGQKVRTPSRIKKEGLATCLDTSLLVCAALEASGLNPAVVFTEGHAFAGVWVVERSFSTAETWDVSEIRKAIAAKEFIPFETTFLTQSRSGTFARAISDAQGALSPAREHEFNVAVDIKRCRSSGIRALPRMGGEGVSELVDGAREPQADSTQRLDLQPPSDWVGPEQEEETTPDSPEGRIDRWQRKLLDLTLRNRLLNFKETKSALPLKCYDAPRLEDELSEGKTFGLLSLPDENPRLGRDPDQYRRETGEEIDAQLIRDSLSRKELCSPLTGTEMKNRLTALYRSSRSDLAEGGTNTLFLAMGFLRWKQSEKETKHYKAPLLLVPISLQRASASSPFTLKHQGDEVRFNLTLLEKLAEQGIQAPLLKGDLPRDEAGLDVPLIFKRMREAVRDVPGFEVVEDIALSTFTFAKYLMWKDLVDRTDQLRQNRLVAHLIDSPDEAFIPEGEPGLPQPKEVESLLRPQQTFTPLPADSSQLAAVAAAEGGRDMVVIGPPGTGKSQTIANIIAHCLAHQKTVLFVSEKAAALDVVYRRLAACGLGDAVLELHSNKAERKKVIEQLGNAWSRTEDNTAETEWTKVSEQLGVEREQLNNYVAALHKRHSNGLTVFRAIGDSVKPVPFELSWANFNAHDEESYERLCELSLSLEEAIVQVQDPGALKYVRVPSGGWSHSWASELLYLSQSVRASALKTAQARAIFQNAVGQPLTAHPATLEPLAFAMLAEQDGERLALAGLDIPGIKIAANQAMLLQEKFNDLKKSLSVEFATRDLLKVPSTQLEADWRKANSSTWPFSMLQRGTIKRALSTYAKATADPARDLPTIESMQEQHALLRESTLKDLPIWNGIDTDFRGLLDSAIRVHETNTCAENAQVATNSIDDQSKTAATSLVEELTTLAKLKEELQAVSGESLPGDLDQLCEVVDELIANHYRLQDWLHWCGLANQARSLGLSPLVDAIEIDPSLKALEAFQSAYAAWWTPLAIDASMPLRTFIGWKHENRIRAFRTLDEQHQKITAANVRRRIHHGLPNAENVAKKSSLGRLRDLMSQQRPREAIRTLLQRLGSKTTNLTPCVLMSPLSIAQYLPADQASFDIVLFDEASQITTWDAIGAIARAKQSIIVGDPKQMPPSRGFGGNQEDDEDLEFHERDQASILDEAVATGVPQLTLRVHYRSKDEGLIAFSNYRYYDGSLVTFPAPQIWGKAVKMHKSNGVYERGGSRTNPIEARMVCDFLVQRMEEELTKPEEDRATLGVVTFNVQQQQRILDFLDKARTDNSALEWFFSEDREEAVIVKNLENIQGDERDIMLFSITFGPDAAGKLSMSFGPMNNDGGQKRLNVAVSRAREEMHVFSSLNASDIAVERVRFQGVRDLKDFLDYVERGPEALVTADTGSLGGVDSPFEADVKAALEALGWEVRTQIGASGYRIDLGIVHPDHAGRYLAGVECDGASYHSSPAARDRDRMREAILVKLGWHIERVWSTEWFTRRHDALTKLDEGLRAQLQNVRTEEQEQESVSASESQASHTLEMTAQTELEPATESKNEVKKETTKIPAEEQVMDPVEHHRDVPRFAKDELNPEAFFDQGYNNTLSNLISEIITEYSPIHLSALAQKIANLHGWNRVGGRIRERVDSMVRQYPKSVESTGVFLWSDTPEEIITWRGRMGRDPSEISVSEIANLLETHATILDAEDPVLALARSLSLSRLAESRRRELQTVMSVAVDRIKKRR